MFHGTNGAFHFSLKVGFSVFVTDTGQKTKQQQQRNLRQSLRYAKLTRFWHACFWTLAWFEDSSQEQGCSPVEERRQQSPEQHLVFDSGAQVTVHQLTSGHEHT